MDLLVVGAGPTGLVLASEVARHGASFRIVDAAAGPTDKSRAIGIQARTLEIFRSMGIDGAFTARGHRVDAVNIYSDAQRIAHLAFDELESPFPYILTLPQSETEQLLIGHLAPTGGRVERGVRLTALAQEADGIAATLAHGDGSSETVRARWIAACDGAHSAVRHALDLPLGGKTYELGFLLADMALDWDLPNNEAHVFISDAGLLAIFPLPGGRHRLVADRPPETADAAHEPDLAECQALVDLRSPVAIRLGDPRWTANFRIHCRITPHLRDGRAFLLGDAAHIHSPALAQGMNTGIQDAYNLAWKLGLVARGIAEPSLLDSYEAERRPIDQGVLARTDFITRLISVENPMVRRLRDRLAPILTSLDVVQQRVRGTISELSVNYRQSPLVEDHWQAEGPAAGERAPDCDVTPWDGQPSLRLFDALHAPRHLLLLAAGPPLPETVTAQFAALAGAVTGRYGDPVAVYRAPPGEHPAICLIRPDGYVGFRGSTAHGPELLDFLARLMPHAAADDRAGASRS